MVSQVLPLTDNKKGGLSWHPLAFFFFSQRSKFKIIQIVLPLALSDFCAAIKILSILSLKRLILIAFYRYFTISVHVANNLDMKHYLYSYLEDSK